MGSQQFHIHRNQVMHISCSRPLSSTLYQLFFISRSINSFISCAVNKSVKRSPELTIRSMIPFYGFSTIFIGVNRMVIDIWRHSLRQNHLQLIWKIYSSIANQCDQMTCSMNIIRSLFLRCMYEDWSTSNLHLLIR